MRCPRCGELSDDSVSICPNCDEILDSSFLGEEDSTPVPGEKTDVGPAPTLMPARLRQKRAGSWNPDTSRPQPPPAPQERRPYLADPVASQPSPLEEAQRAASDLQKFFQNLRAPDRWAASASAVLLVLLALPWQWTRKDEDIIGLVAAWPVGIFAAAVIALVYLRARGADSKLDRTLRSAQFGASAFAAIFCGLFLPWASESQTMRGAVKSFSVALSTPQPGAYLGLVCAAVAVGASFVTFRE